MILKKFLLIFSKYRLIGNIYNFFISKFEAIVKQLEQTLNRLDEVLKEPGNAIIRDSAIQRFEFSLDLGWKSVKAYLEEKKGNNLQLS